MLTLREAIDQERLREFAEQEEQRGVGPVDRKKIEAAIKRVATTPTRSEDRKLSSSSRGGSTGR
jgi:hypothetical protein